MAEYSQIQISAIVNSRRSAKVLQKTCPGIADLYRNGFSYSQIAEQLEIAGSYKVSKGTANAIVCMAIKGHKEDYGMPALAGLISEDEQSRLAKIHREESGRNNGKDSLKRKVGMHAQTPQERSEHSLRNYRNGRGLGGLSHEARVKIGKKAGRKTALVKGYTPWKEAENDREIPERDFLGYLSYSPYFIYTTGSHQKKRNLEKIAAELNRAYHNGQDIRNRSSVRNAIGAINKNDKKDILIEVVTCLEKLIKRT